MNLTLTDDLQEYVDAQLKTGKFRSESDVVCSALRSLVQLSTKSQLEARLEAGAEQVAQGKITKLDDVFEGLKTHLKEKYSPQNNA